MKLLRKVQRDDPNDKSVKRIPPRVLHPIDSDGDVDESNGHLRRITSLLKMLSTARGVVPALVFFAILFALILASTLLSGAVQMEDHKPQLSPAVKPLMSVPPIQSVPTLKRPISIVNSATAPAQPALERIQEPTDPNPLGDRNGTLEDDQKYANAKRDREDEELDHNAGHKVIAVVEKEKKRVSEDGSSRSHAPREMRLKKSERFDLRGLHTISYRLARNGKELPREARAFPMLKGVFVMTLMLPSQSPNNKSSFSAHSAPSQFGCICVDNSTIANSTTSIIEVLSRVQTLHPEKATEIVHGSDEPVEFRMDASTLLNENWDIVEHIKHEILKSGRATLLLANQTQALAMRSLPCAVRFYGSTAIGLCDPTLNNTFTDTDVFPEDVDDSDETDQTKKKKKKRVRNAMVPIGPCGALDYEIAREAVKRRIANIPADEVVTHRINGGKDALVDVLLRSFGFVPQNNTASDLTFRHPQHAIRKLMSLERGEAARHIFFDELHEHEEMSAMCDMCGSTTSTEGNVFANTESQAFTKIFFKKSQNSDVLLTLKNMSKARWKAVADLFQEDPRHEGVAPVEGGNATANITEHFLSWLAMGLREMEAYSKRCDKKKFTDHFTQCFKAAVPAAQRKSRGWSAVAKEFITPPLQGSHPGGHQLRPSRFLSYDVDKQLFPIPSRLIFHPLSAGGHLACYASGDMVCDIVGRSGGWELELIHIVAYAAQSLRRETRRAAALLKSRLQGCLKQQQGDGGADASASSKKSLGYLEKFEKKYGTTDNGLLVDEFSISPSINGNTAPMRYNSDDVVFLDVGGNVGVFAVSMWKRGFRTEVFEALPQNVFLLESAACTNQAEELAMWEEQRSQRVAQHIRRVEKNITADVKNESEVEAILKEARPRLLAAAIETLPKWLRYPGEEHGNHTSAITGGLLHGPQLLPFNIHHTALGNGKKGRSGQDESLVKEGGNSITPDEIHSIALRLLRQVHSAAMPGNSSEGNNTTASASECVMISEQANFGDIVILCNETLVAEAKEALAAAAGSKERSKVRVLKNYIPRGFVELNSLDNILFPKDEAQLIDFNCTTMRERFADVFAASLNGDSLSDEKCDVKRKKEMFEDRARKEKHLPQHAVDDYNTTKELLEFLSFSHSVMKIDVEGQEEFVMQGADSLLSNRSIRPKLILSEVWRKTNIGRYGALMVGKHGYLGLALTDSMWLRSVDDVVAYHAGMPREMDTIVWVAAGFEFLLPPMVLQKPPA